MKRFPILVSALLIMGGALLMGAGGCSSDPNVEGAKLDLNNKDYARALQNVETALQKNPENAEAHLLKGRILQEQSASATDLQSHSNMVSQMVAAYNRAAELDPALKADIDKRMYLAYTTEIQRGSQSFQKGREDQAAYGDAVQFFQNAAVIAPDSSRAHVNIAFAYVNAGRRADAIQPLERAVQAGSNFPETYSLLGELYVSNERAADAVTLLEKARSMFPTNAQITDQLLNAYVKANMMDRATSTFSQEVQREPNNKLYRYNYGSLLLNAERFDEAIEQLKAAIALDENYANAQYNLGAAYINKAVNVNEEIQKKDDDLRARRNSMQKAQIDAAEAELDKMVEERTSLFSQAITPLEKARQLMEASGENVQNVCRTLFQAYVQTKQMDKAQSVQACAGQ